MKTQLISLESHDDLISVRDRLSWAKTPRILLVWPATERIALRPLDLKVLLRHAASLGAQLGLVTRQRNIRREATALGIPVFTSTGEAQRNPWPEKAPLTREYRPPKQNLREMMKQSRVAEGTWQSLFPVRFGSFAIGVLAVLAIVSLFIPRAQVRLSPEVELQTVTLPVQADTTVETVFITGTIPLRQIRVTVEGERQLLSSGSMAVPETRAKGSVTFRNLTENPVRIPVGTVLLSIGLPGICFETTEPAQLPGGINEVVEVPIQAELAGASGNLDAETIQAIEGNLGLEVVVTNPEPTSRGRDRLAQAPTDGDRKQLLEETLDELQVEALSLVDARLEKSDEILLDTIEIAEILLEQYDPPVGQPGQKVTLTLEVEFSAAYIAGADLSELAVSVLSASIPPGYVLAESPIDFEPVGAYRADQMGVISWTMRASRRIAKRIDPGQVISLVRGRRLEDAETRLSESLPLRSSPEILVSPDWWPWLPLIPLNYSIETD